MAATQIGGGPSRLSAMSAPRRNPVPLPEARWPSREEAAGRWTEWYLLNRTRLKLDREKRLIR